AQAKAEAFGQGRDDVAPTQCEWVSPAYTECLIPSRRPRTVQSQGAREKFPQTYRKIRRGQLRPSNAANAPLSVRRLGTAVKRARGRLAAPCRSSKHLHGRTARTGAPVTSSAAVTRDPAASPVRRSGGAALRSAAARRHGRCPAACCRGRCASST